MNANNILSPYSGPDSETAACRECEVLNGVVEGVTNFKALSSIFC